MADEEQNGAKQQQNDDDRKVFAGGLPQEATESDIKEYFSTFGGVTSVNLKMDPVTGRSRGFAFVVFDSEDTLSGVLGQEHAIKGKKVAVKKAASKQGKVRKIKKTPRQFNNRCLNWTDRGFNVVSSFLSGLCR